jgi:hypothetical protein
MFAARIAIIGFIWALLGHGALAQQDICAKPCADYLKAHPDCPRNRCSGLIEGKTCNPYCSSTFIIPGQVQLYSNGKIFDLVPHSVDSPQSAPK